MAGCGEQLEVTVPTKYLAKIITVSCGSTSPYGSPWLCESCAEINAGRDWRKECEEAGERWDDDY